MVFTSFNFLIYFPLVIACYYLVQERGRWVVLLIASYLFYINIQPLFALLIAAITLSTYFLTRELARSSAEVRRKRLMQINIVLILLPLFFFKYFGPINALLAGALQSIHLHWPLPEIKLILPVGLSFYTFMAIGYTIDVYEEEIEAETHPGRLALFIAFFPLILSGPIERAGNMLPQFKNARPASYEMIVQGIKWMLWGYFMKLVVADRIGIYVDAVYANVAQHNGSTLLLASLLYPFQMYADLGGYSLIAIGSARIMGIEVMQNFRRPFFSRSMSEFWRRWHISLISWITHYIYTPIAFALREYKMAGLVVSLMITFLISGLWHGATPGFLMWGLLQGLFLSIEAIIMIPRSQFEKRHGFDRSIGYGLVLMLLTFILFAGSEIFGRAESLAQGIEIYSKILFQPGALFIGRPSTLVYITIGLAMLIIKDFIDEFMPARLALLDNRNKYIRVMSVSTLAVLVILIGVVDGGQFIYFAF